MTVVKRENPKITTCKTTVGQLRTQPLHELLQTKEEFFHYLRINMEYGHIPKTSRMFKTKD